MNEVLWSCLQRPETLRLPTWYLGAGCISQTVWNLQHDKAPAADIKDYDPVYNDSDDLSADAEARIEQRATTLVADLPAKLDVTKPASHLW